jgi:hypothetical protein
MVTPSTRSSDTRSSRRSALTWVVFPAAIAFRAVGGDVLDEAARPMITKCSAISSISLIRCDETKTVRPSRARSWSRVRIQRMPLGIEAVDRLVEHHHPGIAEQGTGDPQALAHAEREAAAAAAGDVAEADDVEHLVDPVGADAVGDGERPQVVVGGAGRVNGPASSSEPSEA